jgi:hypothetical protein
MTQRTESARQALDQYYLSKGEPPDTLETGIIDLLTDLLHLARNEGLDAFKLGQTALTHFVVEIEKARMP